MCRGNETVSSLCLFHSSISSLCWSKIWSADVFSQCNHEIIPFSIITHGEDRVLSRTMFFNLSLTVSPSFDLVSSCGTPVLSVEPQSHSHSPLIYVILTCEPFKRVPLGAIWHLVEIYLKNFFLTFFPWFSRAPLLLPMGPWISFRVLITTSSLFSFPRLSI